MDSRDHRRDPLLRLPVSDTSLPGVSDRSTRNNYLARTEKDNRGLKESGGYTSKEVWEGWVYRQ